MDPYIRNSLEGLEEQERRREEGVDLRCGEEKEAKGGVQVGKHLLLVAEFVLN